MQTISIKCPKCHSGFNLKAANPSALMGKPFKCPKCGAVTPFSALLRRKASPAGAELRTHIAGPAIAIAGASSSPKTQLFQGGASAGAMSSPTAKLIVEKTGATFPLPSGAHTLGRASSDSKASIKLASDPYMSRLHARIIVAPMGGRMKCQLQGLSSVNAIFVNDRRLAPGETMLLKDGDKLLLGMTSVLFKDL